MTPWEKRSQPRIDHSKHCVAQIELICADFPEILRACREATCALERLRLTVAEVTSRELNHANDDPGFGGDER